MARNDLTNEKEVWAAFQQGSKEAFTAIYRCYVKALYNYGVRITSDREILQDSIQDLFFKLWKQRASLSEVSSIKLYLYKGLKSTILDNLKKARKNQLSDDSLREAFFEFVPAEDEKIIAGERVLQREKEFQHIIQTYLTPRQKEALTLLFYDNLPYPAVAELLSLTPKSTYKLVYRALEALKLHLENTVFILMCLLELVTI